MVVVRAPSRAAGLLLLLGCRMYGKIENPIPVRDLKEPLVIERIMRLEGQGAEQRRLVVMLRVQAPTDANVIVPAEPIRLYADRDSLNLLGVGAVQSEGPNVGRLEFLPGAGERLRLELPLSSDLARPGRRFWVRVLWQERKRSPGDPERGASRLYRVRVLRVNYAIVGGLATVLAWSFGALFQSD